MSNRGAQTHALQFGLCRTLTHVGRGSARPITIYQSKRREAADRGLDGVRARIAHPANSPSRSKCVKVAAGGASKIRPLGLRDFSDGRVPCRHLGCLTVIAAARFIGAPRHRWPHASAILRWLALEVLCRPRRSAMARYPVVLDKAACDHELAASAHSHP